jgi:hypothetical protein
MWGEPSRDTGCIAVSFGERRLEPQGHVCFATGCGVSSCDGVTTACPAPTPVPGGTVCPLNTGSSECLLGPAPTCDGVTLTCPAPAFQPAGAACNPRQDCAGNSGLLYAGACNALGNCSPVGGVCHLLDGQPCANNGACQSGVCAGSPSVCQAPSCTDGAQNGTETGVDCGGSCATCLSCVPANCALSNATAGCTAGACSIVSCNQGFADCNRMPSDGCEASLDSTSNCGGCGVVCQGMQSCVALGGMRFCQ